METKPWYLSRTIWVNLFMAITVVAMAFSVNLEDYGFGSDAQAEIASGIVAVVNVANIVLRLVTNKGVTT